MLVYQRVGAWFSQLYWLDQAFYLGVLTSKLSVCA